MVLSLHNLLSETQAPSRVAVLRHQVVAPSGKAATWHRPAYPICAPTFGARAFTVGFNPKPSCLIPMAALSSSDSFRSAFGDTSVNAKQEGTP